MIAVDSFKVTKLFNQLNFPMAHGLVLRFQHAMHIRHFTHCPDVKLKPSFNTECFETSYSTGNCLAESPQSHFRLVGCNWFKKTFQIDINFDLNMLLYAAWD